MIIDVNVNISRWPFRRTPCDELPRLRQKLAAAGVLQAWAGNLDGLFHRDVAGANLRLAEVCREPGDVTLVPFGSINPQLPDWPEDLPHFAEELHMPGIRLHPNYHGYRIDEPLFAELLDRALDYRLVIQLSRADGRRTRSASAHAGSGHRYEGVGRPDQVATQPAARAA